MKIIKVLLCILVPICFIYYSVPKDMREVYKMKMYIPEVIAFAKEHKEDLDVIIEMKSKYESNYILRSDTILEYGYKDNKYQEIDEFYIGHCKYMTELENEKIKILADNLPKESSGAISLSYVGIRINYRQSPGGFTILDLCDFPIPIYNDSNSYLKQIDDNWYVYIRCVPKG